MTDGIFYLKSSVLKEAPAGVKQVALDPVAMGFACGGSDPYCSTAYSSMWQSLGGQSGVVKTLRKKYGIDGRVAFVAFSAAHGFMNPMLNVDEDRADTSAVLLLDATFGGGKVGYVKAAKDAAAGKLLLASATSDKGTTDVLNNGDFAFREFVLKPAGLSSLPSAAAPAGLLAPAEGSFQQGSLWYFRYKDAQVHHWEMGKLLKPMVQSVLLPYWSGATGGVGASGGAGWLRAVVAVLGVLGTIWALGQVKNGGARRAREEG